MKFKLTPEQIEQLEKTVKPAPGLQADEDFIHYLHNFAKEVQEGIMATADQKRLQYYKGMLFALKSVCEVYEDLVRGEYLVNE